MGASVVVLAIVLVCAVCVGVAALVRPRRSVTSARIDLALLVAILVASWVGVALLAVLLWRLVT